MSFNRQSLYLTGLGQIGTGGGAGEEIFSFGLRATGDAGFDAEAKLEDLDMDEVGDAFGDFFGATNTKISSVATLFTVKAAAIGVDGNYLTDARLVEPAPGGVSGSSVPGNRPPNQLAMAVSLRTVTNIGRATKGRFYLPVPNLPITTAGYADSTAVGLVAAQARIFLDRLNVALNVGVTNPATVAIMSDIGTGTSRAVTEVRVGNVMDTIRSRRNALQETYATEPVTFP